MSMNYKQLTAAIRLCGSRPGADRCRACAYFAGRAMHRCIPRMTADAADAIDGLLASLKAEQARCARLEEARENANAACAQWEYRARKAREAAQALRKEGMRDGD